MSDFFLGVIAAAVLIMAVIQVAAVVIAVRLARRVDRLADRLEQDIRPVVASLQALTADASRATSAFKSILTLFRGFRKEARAEHVDEEGSLFVG